MLQQYKSRIPLIALSLLSMSITTEAAFDQQPNNQQASHAPVRKESESSTQEKIDIMKRDQIDNTDTLAIPFDESEVEDEQQIDWDEKKDVFPLPHSH